MISVIEYLSNKGLEHKRRGDEAVMNCPFCDDNEKKFAVNISTGAYNCYHLNTCGVKGSFYDLQKKLRDIPEKTNHQFVNFGKKKEYKRPATKIEKPKSKAVEYLKSRCLTEETINFFGVGSKGDAVMFPYYKAGELANVKYLAIERDENGRKRMWSEQNAEPTLFNRDNITGNELTICEGEIDCMTLHQYGIEAVSVPFGANNYDWVDTEWDFINLFEKINLVFDVDDAGAKAVNELIQKIGSWRSHVVTMPFKDVNACLCMGVDKKTIVDHFRQSKHYSPSILVNPSTFFDEINVLFENPESLEGVKTPWARLNETLKGWRNEELTVWSGRSGAGKSTILNQVLLDLIRQGEKVCIASLEMPAKRYLRWAIIQHLGNSNPHRAKVEETLNYFDNRIYVVNTFEEIQPKELLDVCEYAARRHHVKHFFIDSLMRVSLDSKDLLKSQKNFVSELVSFSKKFTCHIHLVAHPRKGYADQDKPGKMDVAGSGDITNLAHNVIVVWRNDRETIEKAEKEHKRDIVSDMILMVKKNREFGNEGNVKLWFDYQTKKYRETYAIEAEDDNPF